MSITKAIFFNKPILRYLKGCAKGNLKVICTWQRAIWEVDKGKDNVHYCLNIVNLCCNLYLKRDGFVLIERTSDLTMDSNLRLRDTTLP